MISEDKRMYFHFVFLQFEHNLRTGKFSCDYRNVNEIIEIWYLL